MIKGEAQFRTLELQLRGDASAAQEQLRERTEAKDRECAELLETRQREHEDQERRSIERLASEHQSALVTLVAELRDTEALLHSTDSELKRSTAEYTRLVTEMKRSHGEDLAAAELDATKRLEALQQTYAPTRCRCLPCLFLPCHCLPACLALVPQPPRSNVKLVSAGMMR